ncbi:MAG: hypothetical protein PHG67_06380 [Bacteroidales bacterium]|nr:hypothetical protein [Bacteroidales bacterium]
MSRNGGSIPSGIYSSMLEGHLKANGFSSKLDVLESSAWERFWNWAKGNPSATIKFRYSIGRGSVFKRGVLGHAESGSNTAIVYGSGDYFGESYNLNLTDLVNVSTHELGHGIFSFPDSPLGIMSPTYTLGSSLLYFTNSQQFIINQSIWGGK